MATRPLCKLKRPNNVDDLPEKCMPDNAETVAIDDKEVYSWSDVVSALDLIGFWCFLVVHFIVTVTTFRLSTSG